MGITSYTTRTLHSALHTRHCVLVIAMLGFQPSMLTYLPAGDAPVRVRDGDVAPYPYPYPYP